MVLRFVSFAFVLLVLPSGAFATDDDPWEAAVDWGGATPPPPQPTPPPPPREPFDEPALTAADVFADPVFPPPPRRLFEGESVFPTVGISAATRYIGDRGTAPSGDIWMGLRVHPLFGRVNPFVAVGVEMNVRPVRDERYTEIVPEIRVGLSYHRGPLDQYVNRLLPEVQVFGIAGWRTPNRHAGSAARVGIGISAPRIMPEWTELPPLAAPTLIEVVFDTTSSTGPREMAVRVGWHF